MNRIRAAVAHNFGAPLMLEEALLRPPRGREVEVTLAAVGICHTDLHFADGDWGGDLPSIHGHEASGRVSAVGEQVSACAEGDRVIATLIRACGQCVSCASGRPTACEVRLRGKGDCSSPLATLDGAPIAQSMGIAAFAQKVVVDQSQIARVPDGVPLDSAALVSCAVITGVGAVVNVAQVRPGQDVAVIGAGGVGLNSIQGARIAGARRIVAVDLSERKLRDAMAFGATDTVLVSGDAAAPWNEMREKIGRLADAAFVTVGAIPAYESAPKYLAPGGRVIMVGMPECGAKAHYLPVNQAALGQGMIGTSMGDVVLARDAAWIFDLYLQGRLKLDALISKRWPFEAINEAMEDTRAGNARRNVVLFE